MKTKCKIRPYHPFNRWVILAAHDLSLGWSGSQWVWRFGDVQVSNFDTQADAEQEAIASGFEIVDKQPTTEATEMRDEYDFSGGVRGKYAKYDDLLPVCLHEGSDGYWLLDRHNDSIAKFDPALEIEDMERLVALINRKENTQ